MNEKPTNPKKAFGDTKAPLGVVPETMAVWDCLGFLEGALKYGRANWRVAGVQVSTYVDAFERHAKKFVAGEWADPDTQVPHLVSARACLGIILDAFTASMYPVKAAPFSVGGEFLTDDRPPSVDLAGLEKHVAGIANGLRDMFKDRTPRHCTIADTRIALQAEDYPPLTVPPFPVRELRTAPLGSPTYTVEQRCSAVGHMGPGNPRAGVMCSLAKTHDGDHEAYSAHQIQGEPLYTWEPAAP